MGGLARTSVGGARRASSGFSVAAAGKNRSLWPPFRFVSPGDGETTGETSPSRTRKRRSVFDVCTKKIISGRRAVSRETSWDSLQSGFVSPLGPVHTGRRALRLRPGRGQRCWDSTRAGRDARSVNRPRTGTRSQHAQPLIVATTESFFHLINFNNGRIVFSDILGREGSSVE